MADSHIADLEPLVRSLVSRNAVKIPPYPGVVLKLNQIVRGGAFALSDLVKVVSADPLIAGAILKYANSAAVRGGNAITALSDAVARLGSEEVTRIAMAVSLGAASTQAGPLAALRRKVWEESLISAMCCMNLAPARSLDPREAFVCGLLHDFGRLLAVGCLEAILAERKDVRTLPETDWLKFLDAFHIDLGIGTAGKWNLPPVLQSVIACHHKPEAAGPFRAMVDLVVASDAIVGLLDFEPHIQKEDLEGLPYLSPAEIDTVLKFIPEIPSFLASLGEAAPPPKGPPAESQVAPPPSLLDPPTRNVNMTGTLMRSTGDLALQILVIGQKSLIFTGPQKLAENYLTKIKLNADGGPFEIWAHVSRVAPRATGFEVEAKLFALNGVPKKRWQEILETPQPLAATA